MPISPDVQPRITPAIAVLVPCFNEEAAIFDVVTAFRTALPMADVYVFDNNSTDETVARALAAGALVRQESEQGKGNVVRRMFADVEADIFVLVDGDGTYDAGASSELIARLTQDRLDMVVGARVADAGALRRGHSWGNRIFNRVVALVFGNRFRDIFSGYRVMSRRFVKTFPALTTGFEIETELSIHALELRIPTAEVDVPYKARPAGSASKLRTVPDGLRILRTILLLLKEVRPFGFFGVIAAVLFLVSLVLGYPLVTTFLETGLVPRFPTAILATGIAVLGFISVTCGLILDSVARGRRESKRLRYLAVPALPANR